MTLLQELFRAPSEIGDDPHDAKSTMSFDIKVAFSHDPELGNLMKERFSSEDFTKAFEEQIYHAIVESYRQLQNDASVYAGNDWIDDLTVESKMRKFNTGAFESFETEKEVMLTLADVYNKSLDMIHSIVESDVDGADIAAIEKQIEAARRGLGIVNKLKPGPDKVKHAKRVMSNLNKLRSKLAALKKAAKAADKPVISESVVFKLFERVTYNTNTGTFIFESKKDKPTPMGNKNPVAKNAGINKSSIHPDKKNDYNRKDKHKKKLEKE